MAGPHISSQPFAHNSGQDARRPNKKPEGGFKRKRTGCMTCRQRKIRCDERKPQCLSCEKSKRQCNWEGGGSIWKHDQNPSVHTEENKFYKRTPKSFAQEDGRRLAAGAPRSEYQFVYTFGDPGASEDSPPTSNEAAPMPNVHYQELDPRNLQALASAATYQNSESYQNSHMPSVQWVDTERQGSRGQTVFNPSSATPNAAIDPNLEDGAGKTVQSASEGNVEHAVDDVHREEDVDARLAQVLKAAQT